MILEALVVESKKNPGLLSIRAADGSSKTLMAELSERFNEGDTVFITDEIQPIPDRHKGPRDRRKDALHPRDVAMLGGDPSL
jgi:hypothetical protein